MTWWKMPIAVAIMFVPAFWFAVQANFWWSLVPFYLAIPLIVICQIGGVALTACVLCTAFGDDSDIVRSLASAKDEGY